MKVRKGFVSNSSSSSFIVARAQVGDEKFEKVVAMFKDDDCAYPVTSKNYLYVDTSGSGFDEEALAEIGISDEDYMTYYE